MATVTETVKLYDGKEKIVFYPNSHQYKYNKKRLPSVTSITGQIDKSRALLSWSERLATEYLSGLEFEGAPITSAEWQHAISLYRQKRDEGANIGSIVHDWITEWINLSEADRKKKEMPKDEEILNGVIAFLSWVKEKDVKFVESERIIFSKKHLYVGTMDNAYTTGEDGHKQVHIGDFKTSNYVGAEAILQTVGYAIAYGEEMGKNYKKLAIQHLNKKNGDFKVIEFERTKTLTEAFLALNTLKTGISEANKITRKK